MPCLRTWLLLAGLTGVLFAFGDAPKGKKYALLVGVKEYDSDRLAALHYPENDIEELAKLLRRKGGFDEVRVLATSRGKKKADAPTAANVRAALKELFKGKTRHDTVLVALAGHGIQLSVSDPHGNGQDKTFPCFCPSDAQLNDTDYRTGKSPTLINLDDMVRDLGDCGAGAKLLLIDACRNDVKARNVDVGKVLVPKNVMALFSCDSGQKAFETAKLGKGHGVFFYHVLEALRGEARDRDGDVTWDAMSTYVRKHVSPWVEEHIGDGAKQTPHSLNNVAGRPVVLIPSGAATRQTVKNSLDMELVEIPPGEFDMGAPPGEKGGRLMERPVHKVRVTKAFFMGASEVTQAQYLKVTGENPSAFAAGGDRADEVKGMKTDQHPVENVNHADAVAFCKKLSGLPAEAKAKRTYRLPTEAEWEYACRAGSNTAFHRGDKLSAAEANFAEKAGRTLPVRQFKKPNAWGLHDMHGNVREWVADWYDSDYYGKSERDDPKGPARGMRKLLRGGSWADALNDCRSAARELADPVKVKDSMTGFRVVMEQE